MTTVKLNVNHEKRKKLKEATDYYGLELNNDLYCIIIEDYLAKRKENIVRNLSGANKANQKKIRKAIVNAHKQVEKQKAKKENNEPSEVIRIPRA